MNYDQYATLFDKVFPLGVQTLEFLRAALTGKTRILDLGCGRGLYTNALSQDFDIEGIDISPRMIDAARAQFPHIPFSVQDMRCFEGVYDGIFVIGNTLVHLESLEDIVAECSYLYDHLTDNGRLIVQIINYDRIYRHRIDHLPTIERDGVRFVRQYDLQANKVIFKSTLFYQGASHSQSVSLYPLRAKQLVDALTACGFHNIRLYDGFTHQDFLIDQSMQLVVTADK